MTAVVYILSEYHLDIFQHYSEPFGMVLLQITCDTKFDRRSSSKRLRAALDDSAADVPALVQFVTKLPTLTEHKKHYVGTVSNSVISILFFRCIYTYFQNQQHSNLIAARCFLALMYVSRNVHIFNICQFIFVTAELIILFAYIVV